MRCLPLLHPTFHYSTIPSSLAFPVAPFRRAALICWLLPVLILACLAPAALAAQVTLAWNPNPEPNVIGYRIYYGLQSGNYGHAFDVGTQTTCTVTGLEDNQIVYFVVTAYNTLGAESAYSNEVVFPIANPAPNISANGSDGPVEVFRRKPVSLSVRTDPVDFWGATVDLWLFVDAPEGRLYYVEGLGWFDEPTPSAQMPIDAGITVTDLFNEKLPVGNYTFTFAIDDNSDGKLDGTWTDSVTVLVW